ncbi:MAG: cell division protein ZapA [candidate division KSB1 bacterium]|nr:cell division protein ZapA [candidate division KSB1 bacterium]
MNIYGAEYPIKGDVDVDYIRQVAEYVDRKMREVDQTTAAKSSLKVAILAALNIADELFHEREEKTGLVRTFEAKVDQLSRLINENLRE